VACHDLLVSYTTLAPTSTHLFLLHLYWPRCCNCSVTTAFATVPCILQALVLKDQGFAAVAAMPQPLGSRRPSETLPLAGNANKTGNTSFLGAVTTMLKFCIGTGVFAVPHAFSTGGVVP
jgi:hypothetical protein